MTIPSPSARLLGAALQHFMNTGEELSEAVYNVASDLRDYFNEAADNPRAFPPREGMASSLKARARRIRGVRRNDGTWADGMPRERGRGRKNRRQRRHEAAKVRRAARAESVRLHNERRQIEEDLNDAPPYK